MCEKLQIFGRVQPVLGCQVSESGSCDTRWPCNKVCLYWLLDPSFLAKITYHCHPLTSSTLNTASILKDWRTYTTNSFDFVSFQCTNRLSELRHHLSSIIEQSFVMDFNLVTWHLIASDILHGALPPSVLLNIRCHTQYNGAKLDVLFKLLLKIWTWGDKYC